MPWARTGHTYVAYALGLLVVVQFLLAGLGTIGGDSIDPHQILGQLMQLLALVLLVFAVLARYSGPLLGMSIFLFVAMVMQTVWVQIEDPLWIRSIHVLMALLIALTIREMIGVSRREATAHPDALAPDAVRHT